MSATKDKAILRFWAIKIVLERKKFFPVRFFLSWPKSHLDAKNQFKQANIKNHRGHPT